MPAECVMEFLGKIRALGLLLINLTYFLILITRKHTLHGVIRLSIRNQGYALSMCKYIIFLSYFFPTSYFNNRIDNIHTLTIADRQDINSTLLSNLSEKFTLVETVTRD